MRDFLLDIVQHTQGLGRIEMVKVTGTEKETKIIAVDTSTSSHVVVEGGFIKPVPDFVGTFGMPHLNKLSTILGIEEYRENASIKIVKDSNGAPTGVHFENENGDFTNDYRFMSANIVSGLIKDVEFKGVRWGVELEPTVAGITRLKYQANVNSNYDTFKAKTENKNLKFYFGDQSNHAGNFVFASDVVGSINKPWDWPTSLVVNILALPGDKIMRISDEGAMQITVNSGLSIWNYIMPAHTK